MRTIGTALLLAVAAIVPQAGCATASSGIQPPRPELRDRAKLGAVVIVLDDDTTYDLESAEVREEWLLGDLQDGTRIAVLTSRIRHVWVMERSTPSDRLAMELLALAGALVLLPVLVFAWGM